MKRHSSGLMGCALGLVLLLSSVMALVGCSSDGGSGEDVPIVSKLPEGADHFIVIDVETLRTDDDLGDVYEALGIGDDLDAFQALGISGDDVDSFAKSGDTVVLEGHFDLDAVRDVLEDLDFDEDEYRGIETWEEGSEDGMALVSDSCIIMRSDGDIDDCIDLIKGQGEPLYDDDLADTVDRLPSGLVIMYGGGVQGFVTEEDYEGLEATGISMGKKDANSLWVVAVLRFEDEGAAQDAVDDIREVSPEGFSNTKVTQDGRHIEVTADVDVDDSPFF